MSVNLETMLANHQIAEFSQIGKQNWTYLSYDETSGWDVVKFEGLCGYLKQFFRWLGFYSSTHLTKVAHRIEREPNVPEELLTKIRACWQRQGNAPISPEQLPRVEEALTRVNRDPAIANHVGLRVNDTLISIEQGDITQVSRVKAIVNAANPSCLGGGGVDGAIHRAAGPSLLEECRRLPETHPGSNIRCETGNAVITRSGNLAGRGIERIIHTVGPVRLSYIAAENSKQLLQNAYINSLNVAYENGIRSIAFPAISTGVYAYPLFLATRDAIEAIEQYLVEHPNRFNEIKLIFDNQENWDRAVQVNRDMRHNASAVADNP